MAGKDIHADAVAYAGPGELRAQAGELESNLNKVLQEAEALATWKGSGGSAFQSLSAAWHTDATKLKQILLEISDAMETNQKKMRNQDEEQGQSINSMRSQVTSKV